MHLKDYLLSTMDEDQTLNSRYTEFADKLGVTLYCVRKWLDGQRGINDPMKLKIEKMTGGRVSLREMMHE